MDFPKSYKYTKDHEWIEVQNGQGTIGVTDYAVEQLGDIVHLDLPEVGESFDAGDSFGTIESTKTVSDLYMPISGKIVQINDSLILSPENLQDDAYLDGWLVKVELNKDEDVDELMNAEGYEEFILQQED